jgi:hypothetical protein
MIEFKLLYARDNTSLGQEVSKFLNEGFILHGYTYSTEKGHYQAVVKYPPLKTQLAPIEQYPLPLNMS